MGEVFAAQKDYRKAMRAVFGVRCPQCATARPKAQPSILLHGQRCKVDGYKDPRPDATTAELAAGLAPHGFEISEAAP